MKFNVRINYQRHAKMFENTKIKKGLIINVIIILGTTL